MTASDEKLERATTVGRFQLLTPGHVAGVMSILKEWETLTICLSDPSQRVDEPQTEYGGYEDDEYLQLTELKFAASKNPFAAEERIAMWNAALTYAGVGDRVKCRAIPRLSLYPDYFNATVPPDTYDLVFGNSTDPYDVVKIRSLSKILRRTVYTVDLEVMFNATQARAKVAAGHPWSAVLAPGVADVFYAIGGPERVVVDPEAEGSTER